MVEVTRPCGDNGAVPEPEPAPGIHRDRWGVPHVVGRDLLDLARLQGVATATDRTWQLEHARRRATGRTAELLSADRPPLEERENIELRGKHEAVRVYAPEASRRGSARRPSRETGR